MTDLMAKDLDLALAYAAPGRRAPGHHGHGPPGAHRRHRPPATGARTSRRVAKVVLRPGRAGVTEAVTLGPATGARSCPALMLAADHRARGVMTIERYADYLRALERGPARTATASWPPPSRWPTWPAPGPSGPTTAPISRINRTGLAGSAFELDDRLVASVGPGGRRRVDRGSST